MGDLVIRVLEARNLIPADHNGKSDPFVTVEILEDPMQKKQKTHCIHKNLNPVWQETFNFRAPNANSTILFKVWDRDLFKKNDPLGNVKVAVNQLPPKMTNNLWLDLMGVPSGKLHVEIVFTPFSGGMAGRTPAAYPQTQQYGQPPVQQQGMQPAARGPMQQQQPPYYPQNNQQGYSSQPPPVQSYPSQPPAAQVYSAPQISAAPSSLPPPPPPINSATLSPPPMNLPPPPPIDGAFAALSLAGDDGDVGTDYSKLASDFSMAQNQGSYNQQQQYQNYSQQSQNSQQSNYSQSNYQNQQQGNQQWYQPQQQQQQYSQNYPQQQAYQNQPYQPQQQQYPQQPSYPQQNYPQQGGYPQQQMSQQYPQQSYPPQQPFSTQKYLPQQGYVTAQGLIAGPKVAKFFVDIRKQAFRDYIVIMDMSGSMSGARWEQAKSATMKIAPFACQADPDGITLYLFNSKYLKFPNLQNPDHVRQIFSREKPSSTTDLAGVLRAAFQEHFSGSKPSTILVVTDGEPDSQAAVAREIVSASQRVNSQEDLSVSFIQIGHDAPATKFLKFLDDNLRSKGANDQQDIVDTVSSDDLGSYTFDQLIQKSIYD